jgi:hypothetical protein
MAKTSGKDTAMSERWNSGRSIAIGAALLISIGLITGGVVAKWYGKEGPEQEGTASWMADLHPVAAPPEPDFLACNQYANSVDAATPEEVPEKAAIEGDLCAELGATAGTASGLDEANQKDGRSVAAYRACMQEWGYTN